jgi:hypothetical protein
MKSYGRVDVHLHAFRILAIDSDVWLGSRPGHIAAGKEHMVPIE